MSRFRRISMRTIILCCSEQELTIGAAFLRLLETTSILKPLGLTWRNLPRRVVKPDSLYASGSQPTTNFSTGPASFRFGFALLPPRVKTKSYKAHYDNL